MTEAHGPRFGPQELGEQELFIGGLSPSMAEGAAAVTPVAVTLAPPPSED